MSQQWLCCALSGTNSQSTTIKSYATLLAWHARGRRGMNSGRRFVSRRSSGMSRTGSSRRNCLLRPRSSWRRSAWIIIRIGGIIILILTLVIPIHQVIPGRMMNSLMLRRKRGISTQSLLSLPVITYPHIRVTRLSSHLTRSSWSTSSAKLASRPLLMVWRIWTVSSRQVSIIRRLLYFFILTRTVTLWLRQFSRSSEIRMRLLKPPWRSARSYFSNSSTILNPATQEQATRSHSNITTTQQRQTADEDLSSYVSKKVLMTSQSL